MRHNYSPAHLLRATLALLAITIALAMPMPQAGAVPPGESPLAVVRLPSHGASATVIATEPGKTLVLGCGHAFTGSNRSKPIVIDVPTPNPGPAQRVGVQLLDVNYEDDLSLVLLRTGPVDYCCPVAGPGHRPGSLLSVGYDEMQVPAKVLPAHIVSLSPQVTYTRERPWHGRSGGALIDADSGTLIGVVQGYELSGPRRGMYVSHQAILRFLERFRQHGIRPSAPESAPLPSFPVPFYRPGGG
jgi:hypothetical protein